MSRPSPAVSVVMPVHNARPYLEESVGSILRQTFADFELVVVENGSTDGSGEVLRALAEREPRIRLVQSSCVLGSAGASNLAISHARGTVIARMDADDVSHPCRLERQLEVFERHPDAVVVGTLYEWIDEAGRRVRARDRSRLTRPGTECPFAHGSSAFRRQAFEEVGGYRDDWAHRADLDFLQRLGEVGRVFVLPDALYAVRFHAGSMTARAPLERAVRVAAARDRAVSERFPRMSSPRSGDERTVAVLYEHEAMRLWRGGRPALLSRLAAHGLVRRLRRRPWLLLWAGWGRVSPGSLRRAIRLWIWARDRAAARRLPNGEPVEWRFG
jgi:glycosyltransferase involved in cell wall biosynthesis